MTELFFFKECFSNCFAAAVVVVVVIFCILLFFTGVLYCLKGYIRCVNSDVSLKGSQQLLISMFYVEQLYLPLVLIPVSSKLGEKWGRCVPLTNSVLPILSRHFEKLISFQDF